jgi:hypothetical protein
MVRILLATLFFVQVCACELRKEVDKTTAREIAEKNFQEITEGTIDEYAIECTKDTDDDSWKCVVVALGENLKPGYHWLVKISPNGEEVSVILGK